MLNVCAQTILSDTLKINAQVCFGCDVYVDLHRTYIYIYIYTHHPHARFNHIIGRLHPATLQVDILMTHRVRDG